MSKGEMEIRNGERRYFTIVPNLVDDLDLTPYAFRLYVHLRRVAGEEGTCWQSTETLARACRMGVGSVSRAKRELEARGLIRIREERGGHGIYHVVEIVDIWPENVATYQPATLDQPDTPRGEPSRGEGFPPRAFPRGNKEKPYIGEEEPTEEELTSRTAFNAVRSAPTADTPGGYLSRKEKDAMRGRLERYFAARTGLPLPPRETERQRKAGAELWWNPLRAILDLVGWDEGEAQSLLDAVLAHMEREDLTVSSPKSVLNVARAFWARKQRRGGYGPEPAGLAAVRQYLRREAERHGNFGASG